MEHKDKLVELKFQHFFTRYFPRIKNFAQMLLKSEADAEDVAQEVFCKLWLQPEIWLDNERDMDDYLFIMTRNIVFNIFKHQQIERDFMDMAAEKAVLAELMGEEQILKNIYYKEMLMTIYLELERMPAKRREIFKLSRFEKLSNKEIAEKMGVSVRTVEHHIYLALTDLKKILFFLLFFPHLFK